MKKLLLAFFVITAGLTSLTGFAQQKMLLPNGWTLSPAGQSFPLGDLPLNIAVAPSGKLMAVTNNGQSVQSIQLIDPVKEKILDVAEVKKAWYGLKFSRDGKYLFASGGNDNWILQYAIKKRKLILKDSIKLGDKWPEKISPAGIDLDEVAGKLYVVTKENNSLYVVDLSSKKILQQYRLPDAAYSCLLSPDKKELYISV
ncbi:MAG TPA: YncE family protein, partial [Chitinophagaceae bacterium]|nr:YncE family protein [Chitinophagaceae bacterium]